MKISKYFTLREATYSATAEARKIDNSPNDIELANIRNTAESLDSVWDLLGYPVLVSSWFRSAALNKAVGGSRTSSHLSGKAVDFSCPAFGTIEEVCKKISESNLQFDQLIFEQNGSKQWCHLGFGYRMRGQVLSWSPKRGYKNGIMRL